MTVIVMMMMMMMRMKPPTDAAMAESLDPRPASVSGADTSDGFLFIPSSVKVHLKSFISMLKS